MGNRAESQELICLGSRIRELRLSAGLSQEALAEKAGISPHTVSRIEGGLTEMYVETFRKLVHALSADAGYSAGRNSRTVGTGTQRAF